jgi:hypothetical protein
MKIEKSSENRTTTVHLIGQFQAFDLGELKRQLEGSGALFALDLEEVTVVDVEVVRFLAECEANEVKIAHCPRYIREWIARERRP